MIPLRKEWVENARLCRQVTLGARASRILDDALPDDATGYILNYLMAESHAILHLFHVYS